MLETLQLHNTLQDNSHKNQDKYSIIQELKGEDVVYIQKKIYIKSPELYEYLYSELICTQCASNIVSSNIHPCFLKLHDYELTPKHLQLLLDRAQSDMVSWLRTETNKLYIKSAFMQIMTAIAAYSDNYILHNDLYPTNILMMPSKLTDINIKINAQIINIPVYGYLFCIADFGLSTINTHDEANVVKLKNLTKNILPLNIHILEYNTIYKRDLLSVILSFYHLTTNQEIKSIMSTIYTKIYKSDITSHRDIIIFIQNYIIKLFA